MDTLQTIIIIIGFAIIVLFLYFKDKEKKGDQSTVLFQEQLKEIRQALSVQQGDMHKQIQTQFAQSAQIIREVTERLTKLDDTNKQVMGFAEQLQSLENILKNPKQRGILGEYFLETLLKNIFAPGQYQMQYKFNDGMIVDAAVFVKDKIIPIDSKFSLENYNKILEEKDPSRHEQLEKQFKLDLKTRIDETAKYIRPNEGTMDFAFMFIPSEGIYYDLLVNQVGAIKVNTCDLIEYAFKNKHVIIVSPTSFLAYLQTVLHGLRALQVEESAKEIIKRVEMLQRHLLSYEDFMKKVGSNLSTTVNMYNTAYVEFKKIDKDVAKIAGVESTVEPLKIERPQEE
ncbi:DNA recombination protein RmuC [Candidatus Falkowbacteria bacterium]|nr:DNA recombination protein RmuC [Candidatus Falkowbacteria bacterium]